MRRRLVAVVLLAICLMLTNVSTAEPEGDARKKAIEALKQAARGKCPVSMMSPMLLDACESQQPRLGRMLDSFGPIDKAVYRGIQPLPNGASAEAYKVHFEKGTMLWLASLGPDGKLLVLAGGGEFRPY